MLNSIVTPNQRLNNIVEKCEQYGHEHITLFNNFKQQAHNFYTCTLVLVENGLTAEILSNTCCSVTIIQYFPVGSRTAHHSRSPEFQTLILQHYLLII